MSSILPYASNSDEGGRGPTFFDIVNVSVPTSPENNVWVSF
jgi:hypothetical protein